MRNASIFDEDFFDHLGDDIEYELPSSGSEPYFEYDNKRVSCSFTGHRNLTDTEKATLIPSGSGMKARLP